MLGHVLPDQIDANGPAHLAQQGPAGRHRFAVSQRPTDDFSAPLHAGGHSGEVLGVLKVFTQLAQVRGLLIGKANWASQSSMMHFSCTWLRHKPAVRLPADLTPMHSSHCTGVSIYSDDTGRCMCSAQIQLLCACRRARGSLHVQCAGLTHLSLVKQSNNVLLHCCCIAAGHGRAGAHHFRRLGAGGL